MKRNRLVQGMAVFCALGAVAVTGCSQAGQSTKAGGSTTPVTLRLGTNDDSTAPSARAIETFADQVEERSGGELVIEPVWAANQVEVPDWDQRVARMVVSGDLDMGLIPARAWDTEGVGSLRALSAPLLLTSQPLVDEVVRSDVAQDALAGLETAGVTGLALVPEGLRHVFSYGDPLVTPEDFASTTIRTPRSDTGYAVFRAWGASADDLLGEAFDEGAATGSVAGAESSFARAGGLPGLPTTVAANLTTYANVNTLVVQTKAFEGLTSGHADVLREAAVATRDAIVADPPDEAALAQEFCAQGGRVVAASDADLSALELASQPVYAELERDPATQRMLEQILQMKADIAPPAPIAQCGPAAGTVTPSKGPAGVADTGGLFPEGVYRMEIGEAAFLAEGISQEDAGNHAGRWTLTFRGGGVVIEDVRTRDGRRSSADGAYCVSGERVSVVQRQKGQCEQPVLFSARWQVDGRELRFTDVHDGATNAPTAFFDALWGSQVWTRID